MPKTLFDKIWDSHVVSQEPGSPAVLYIDLHLVHVVTSPQAFTGLRARGLKVRRPDRTIATVDHSIPTTDRSLPIVDAQAAAGSSLKTALQKPFTIMFTASSSEMPRLRQ